MYTHIAENIDRMITLEMRPPGVLDGVVVPLYEHVREAAGGPTAWHAATLLSEKVKPGTTVYVITGHVVPVVMPDGETDGPLGAAALARSLSLGLGAQVVLLCDEPVTKVLSQTCRAIGLNVHSQIQSAMPRTVSVQGFSTDIAIGVKKAEELLADENVSAVISVEKIGRNRCGVYHTGMGNDTSMNLAKLDLLVDLARERDILTIGIGDLGNEIGFGLVEDAVRKIVPFANECQCPCQEGGASNVSTECLVVAGCSNWGAYGITAALAVQLENLDLVHTGEMEKEMIFQCTRAGGVDGLSGALTYEVDGIDWKTHARWIDVLRDIIRVNTTKHRPTRWNIEVKTETL